MASNITLRDYQPSDRDQIFTLMEEIYDAEVVANSRSHWEWQYHDNPRNPEGRPAIRVADRDGEVVATICGVRQEFWIDGTTTPGMWVVDFMARQAGTEERERHRFGKRLAVECRDTMPLIAGVNRPALNRYWKRILGDQVDICAVPMMIRPIRADRLARAKVKGVASSAAAAVGRIAGPLVFRTRNRRLDRSITLSEIERFGPEFDAFFRVVAPSFRYLSVRDADYLNWRYVDIPCRSYRAFAAHREGELAGWFVTRAFESDGLDKGRIVDMLARSDDGDAWYTLIRGAVESCADAGADLVHGLGATSAVVMAAYRDCGFRSNPEHARASQYIAYTALESVDPETFYDGDRWYVMLGDSDTDFATVV
jgi:hypothetical protein